MTNFVWNFTIPNPPVILKKQKKKKNTTFFFKVTVDFSQAIEMADFYLRT